MYIYYFFYFFFTLKKIDFSEKGLNVTKENRNQTVFSYKFKPKEICMKPHRIPTVRFKLLIWFIQSLGVVDKLEGL
jgi:hypothetical protein